MSNHREEQKQFYNLLEYKLLTPNAILAGNSIYCKIDTGFENKLEPKYRIIALDGSIISNEVYTLSEIRDKAEKHSTGKFKLKYYVLNSLFALPEAYYGINSEHYNT